MNKMLSTYGLRMKAVDTTEKGRVTILANGLNIEDAQGDISMNGSFAKTLNDFNNGKRNIFHYKNHDKNDTIGFVVSGKESPTDLVLESQLNLNKQIGLETYEDYKLAQELGKNIEHSIGVYAIKRDAKDSRKVLEWQLEEVSTLTKRGANPSTGFINLKSIDADTDPKKAIEYLRAVLRMKYSDDKLRVFNEQLELMEKYLSEKGVEIVQCPHCGFSFDYNGVEHRTFDTDVIDTIVRYRDWKVADIVREEMDKLEQGLRESVISIISDAGNMTTKSADDILNISYGYCPKCYGRVYSTSVLNGGKEKECGNDENKKPSEDTSKEAVEDNTSEWEKLRNALR